MAQQNLAVSNEFNAKLESLHLDSVVQVLVNTQGWAPHRAKRALADYKRLLFVVAQHPNQMLVPTSEVDAVHHIHLEMGSQFESDCQLLFNRLLLHKPCSVDRNEVEQKFWQEALQKTKMLFETIFGSETMDFANPGHCFIGTATVV